MKIATKFFFGLAVLGLSACIAHDTDIQFVHDCGIKWCVTIPAAGVGQAWGAQPPTFVDIAVQNQVGGGAFEAIKACVCMTPAESDVLDAGCVIPPCDPEFVSLKADVVNAAFEACENECVESYQADLSQDTNQIESPHNNCLEASVFWVPVKSEDTCSVPSEECPGYQEPTGDGGGPEPWISYTISCSGGTCTVPDALLDDIDANPELAVDSATRLTQAFSGPTPIGYTFSGIVTNNSLAYKLGFRNGDVLQEVNGVPFKQPSDYLEIFQELRVSASATAKVKRGSNTIFLNFQRTPLWP